MNSMSLSATPRPERHRHAVAGTGVGVRRDAEDPARTAGREHHRPARDRRQAPAQQIPGDHAHAAAAVLDELPGEELLVDGDAALDQLLVEDLDQHVPGDVRGEDGARRPGGAERPLGELAVLAAREHRAPVLELVDVVRRLLGEELDRVLVAQEVGALDGVEGVALGAVLAGVPERGVDPALGGAGVAACRDGAWRRPRRRRPRRRPRWRRASPRSPPRSRARRSSRPRSDRTGKPGAGRDEPEAGAAAPSERCVRPLPAARHPRPRAASCRRGARGRARPRRSLRRPRARRSRP